ncbi:MAG: hypothetical protein O2909_12205 [Chloroflexi bacterium]|nr:hypothetical protein [Chloroflexota bacterium]MDA1220182.1 hypothetical protein [Chloroflexota bacterium]
MNIKLAQLLAKLTTEEEAELETFASFLLARRDLDSIKPAGKQLHSILELRGLGKEIWEGIDAQEYVDQERNSWNG